MVSHIFSTENLLCCSQCTRLKSSQKRDGQQVWPHLPWKLTAVSWKSMVASDPRNSILKYLIHGPKILALVCWFPGIFCISDHHNLPTIKAWLGTIHHKCCASSWEMEVFDHQKLYVHHLKSFETQLSQCRFIFLIKPVSTYLLDAFLKASIVESTSLGSSFLAARFPNHNLLTLQTHSTQEEKGYQNILILYIFLRVNLKVSDVTTGGPTSQPVFDSLWYR